MLVFLIGLVAGAYLSYRFPKVVDPILENFIPNTQIVKFKTNLYAIRKSTPFGAYSFRDLKTPGEWRGVSDPYFGNCLGSLEECSAVMQNDDIYGEPVDETKHG